MLICIIGVFVVVASDTAQTYHVAIVGFLAAGLVFTTSAVNSLVYSPEGSKEAAAAGHILLSMVAVRTCIRSVSRNLANCKYRLCGYSISDPRLQPSPVPTLTRSLSTKKTASPCEIVTACLAITVVVAQRRRCRPIKLPLRCTPLLNSTALRHLRPYLASLVGQLVQNAARPSHASEMVAKSQRHPLLPWAQLAA